MSGRKLSEAEKVVPLTRVINLAVHNRQIEVIRTLGSLRMRSGERDLLSVYEDYAKPMVPIVYVQSDKGQSCIFRIEPLITIFEDEILGTIIDVCAEHSLHLDDEIQRQKSLPEKQ